MLCIHNLLLVMLSEVRKNVNMEIPEARVFAVLQIVHPFEVDGFI